jgi:hypothetical protein
MRKEIVIAAYDKPLDWLSQINEDVKKTIYKKGNSLPLKDNEILIEPNIGRCVHSFFYHIYNNYDNLADVTYFGQDFPFDHWGNMIEIVNGDMSTLEKAELKIGGYYGFHNNTFGSAWPMYPSHQFGGGVCLNCQYNGSPHDSGMNVDNIWSILFSSARPNSYDFIPGGHFAITKEQVRKRSKELYKKVLDLLEQQEKAPWEIERLECYIFNENHQTNF